VHEAGFRWHSDLGWVEARASKRPGSDASLPVALRYSVAEAERVFSLVGPIRARTSGRVSLDGTAELVLDEQLLPRPGSVAGEGSITLRQGRLSHWPVLHALGDALHLPALRVLEVDEWSTTFRVTDSRVTLQRSTLRSGSLAMDVGGGFDHGGSLDLAATLRLPHLEGPGGSAPAQVEAYLVSGASSADGRLPIGVTAAGRFESPRVSLDMGEARANLAAHTRREAERRALETLREAAGRGAD
jgi:hypothetical protein